MRRLTPSVVNRWFRALLNLILLLSIIPAIVIALLDLISVGRTNLTASGMGLNVLNYSLVGLLVWHLFVWEHRIKISRTATLLIVRALKAAWICVIPMLFMLPALPPPKFVIPFIVGGVTYALIRHLFAPRFQI